MGYIPKVLLIEDSEIELEAMLHNLSRLPVVFLIAVNGQQAYDVFVTIKLDLVVTDGTYDDSDIFIPLISQKLPTILYSGNKSVPYSTFIAAIYKPHIEIVQNHSKVLQ